MFDDWQPIRAQVKANFEKVKYDFNVVQLSMQDFSNSFVGTYNVFVKSIDGKSQQGQAFKVQIYYNFILKKEVLCKHIQNGFLQEKLVFNTFKNL